MHVGILLCSEFVIYIHCLFIVLLPPGSTVKHTDLAKDYSLSLNKTCSCSFEARMPVHCAESWPVWDLTA